ncbi:mandelate racemase/muconate lactonizing enzyme family protein [Stella sp.]|uniref:mandelate racemase/muconate lactonizing enzyme family protein n=1 Tax=Stella sp. TaxID=2912054 RepID=UPI0035AD9724
MRIRRITALEFHRVIDPPLWNPATVWRERRAPLLRVEADDGTVGIGEAWCRQEEIGRSFAALRRIAEGLPGRDPEEVRSRAEPSARDWPDAGAASALDMALADLAARRAGRPLAALFGAADAGVAAYASGGLYAPEKDPPMLAREMAGYVAAGFPAVKMKVGALEQHDDMIRVRAVRRAIGDAVLIVDGVERYDREAAHMMAWRLADAGVAAFQAPMAAADVAGLAWVARRSPIPLVLGEAEFDHARLAGLVASGAAGWLQVNPGLVGGPTAMVRLAELARRHGVPLSPQCHATAVLQAAALHCGTIPGVGWVEFHQVHDHLHALLPAELRHPRGGRIAIPAAPGLGFDLPADATLRAVFRVPG